MRLSGLLIWILVWFQVHVQALVLIDSTLASACVYYELQYDWGCNSHSNGMKAYACRCGNTAWLGSVTNCVYENTNSTRLRNHALRHISTRCLQKGGFEYSLADMQGFYKNATSYLREPTKMDLTMPVDLPLRVNESSYAYYHKGFKDFTFSVQRSQWFGWGLVFYWATILVLASIFNLSKRVFGFTWETNWIRRTLTLPSTFGKYHNSPYTLWKCFQFYFPTRLQSWVIAVFLIQTIVSCCVGYNTISMPHPYLTSRWYANLDLISYRTDLMAISLFPIVYFFGIRNNPFTWITGISFATFNLYHKWTAYVMVILAFIHSIIWTVWAKSKEGGGYLAWWPDAYWQWGVFATMLSFFMVAHSHKWIRDLAYEFFLIFHKLFNVMFIVCMYYHLNTLGWLGWVWSMVGIWGFDRVMRFAKIILCGGLQTATVTDCGNGVIRMKIKNPRLLKFYPGSYAYVYFFSTSDPWIYSFQSHPFTVLSVPDEDESSLTIIFKAKKGITRNVLNRLLKSGVDELKYKVFVEGPYGAAYPCHKNSTRKFIGLAAGLGISAVFPHIKSVIEQTSTNIVHELTWVSNDMNCLNWFSKELAWLASNNCKITFVYTKDIGSDTESVSDYSEKPKSIQDQKISSKIEVLTLSTRPDMNQIVHEAITSSEEDISFVSCGPSSFIDAVRYSVKKELANAKVDVDLEEESFTW
ncbi:Fre1 [Kluyveromyces lactis]|nr:Fre1 [Kluyveromyces lactis]